MERDIMKVAIANRSADKGGIVFVRFERDDFAATPDQGTREESVHAKTSAHVHKCSTGLQLSFQDFNNRPFVFAEGDELRHHAAVSRIYKQRPMFGVQERDRREDLLAFSFFLETKIGFGSDGAEGHTSKSKIKNQQSKLLYGHCSERVRGCQEIKDKNIIPPLVGEDAGVVHCSK